MTRDPAAIAGSLGLPPDFLKYAAPSMAVACPECHARIGTFCKRPSGHKAMLVHKARHTEADRLWELHDLPTITHHRDGTFTFDGPGTRPSAQRPATAEGDDTMKKRKGASARKTKQLTARQRGKSANTSINRAVAADSRARKTNRLDEIAAFITGKPATAKVIGAEFELLEHSVRAAISGLKKPKADGGRGLAVKSEKNAAGATEYSIAK